MTGEARRYQLLCCAHAPMRHASVMGYAMAVRYCASLRLTCMIYLSIRFGVFFVASVFFVFVKKKSLNGRRPFEHPLVRGKNV